MLGVLHENELERPEGNTASLAFEGGRGGFYRIPKL